MASNTLAVRVPQSLSQIPAALPRVLTAEDFAIVDGTNLVCLQKNRPQLSNLIAVVLEIARTAGDFGVVFDANTFYTLRDAGRMEDARAYEYLITEHPDFFVEVTGGTRADDVILAEADAREATVVSNDRFNPYITQYPWVTKQDRILRVNSFRGNLFFNGRRLSLSMPIQRLMADLETALARR